MKNSMIILLTGVTFSVTSQIKVFSGGYQAYGSTTAPAYGEKHHFAGDLVVSEAGNTSSGCALLRANGSSNASSASRPDFTWLGDNNTGLFRPASSNIGFTTGGTERMRLTNNGNLLIGSTSDNNAQRCLINGALNNAALTITANHATNYSYAFITNVNNSTAKAIAVIYNGTEKFSVRGNGDVFATNAYYSASDRNLKENIDTIPGALGKILQLTGVTYNFKTETLKSNAMQGTILPNGTPKQEIGLIAQDVELVVPEAVGTMDNGTKAIAYQNIVPLLIEAIKSQNKTITALQQDVSQCCSKASDTKNNRSLNPADNNTSGETSSYLGQNKPNPFNKETVIDYNVVGSGTAAILVFDMTGKLLKTMPVKIPGKGSITINANDFQPGMYYYSLIVNDTEIDTKKMILTN